MRKNLLGLLGLATAALLSLGCSGAPDEEPTAELESGEVEEETVLDELGVDTDVGPRLDTNGDAIAEQRHPLGRPIASLTREAELFGAGFSIQYPDGPESESNYFLLDHPTSEQPVPLIEPTGDQAWTQAVVKAALGADVDGDGFEEVAVVYFLPESGRLALRVIDDAKDDFEETETTLLEDLETPPEELDLSPDLIDVECPDLDGDGACELTVGFAPSFRLYVFDDGNADFRLLDSVAYEPLSDEPDAVRRVEVSAADLDLDARDDLIVAASDVSSQSIARWVRYSWKEGALTEQDSGLVATAQRQLILARTAVGDFDGDRLPEVVFTGATTDGGFGIIMMEDVWGNGSEGSADDSFQLVDVQAPENGFGLMLPCAAADFDHDGQHELVAGTAILRFEDGAFTTSWGVLDDPLAVILFGWSRPAIGDFDGDPRGRDDVAWVSTAGLTIVGLDSSDEYTDLASWSLQSASAAPVIASVNCDDDSVIVEYDNQHEVVFSEPIVVAVLASAPYHAGVDHAEGSTTFGTGSSTSNEHNGAVGIYFGGAIGYSHEAPLFGKSAGSSELKVGIEVSIDFTFGFTSEVEFTQAYTNPEGQDLVVFTAVPYDVYTYTVLSSPNPDAVGTKVTIELPRDAATHHLEREYYNEHNGDAPDIDSRVLGHILGSPESYPSQAQAEQLSHGGAFYLASTEPDTCSGSGGTVAQGLQLSNGRSVGVATDVKAGFELTNTAGGFLTSVSGGAHAGYEYTYSWTESTFIEGEVGDMLPASYEPELSFDWGVFAYEYRDGSESFPVITYWVE